MKTRELSVRFWEKVAVRGSDECWLWIAGTNSDGYGTFSISRDVSTSAHRVAYELANGEIPPKYDVHHTCDVRLCMNPQHLTAITKKQHKAETWLVCKNGHEFKYLRLRKDGTVRQRACGVCSKPKPSWVLIDPAAARS